VSDNEALGARLRRIEGQVKGIQRMLEEGRPCEDVITQVMAARAALDKVALSVMADHMEECFAESSLSSTDKKATLERALTLFLRMSPGSETSHGK
jgi:CsoR family transcriptional regulator, copper-sensing transcriptional repressor